MKRLYKDWQGLVKLYIQPKAEDARYHYLSSAAPEKLNGKLHFSNLINKRNPVTLTLFVHLSKFQD